VKTVYYELTTYCPARCPHCHIPAGLRHDFPRQRDFCDFAIDMMILRDKLGVENVVLSGGEPTFHPDFLSMVKFASKLFKTAVISNGFNPKLLKEASAQARIWVSLDYYGEKQDRWRKTRGLWRKYEAVADIANIRSTLLSDNLPDIEKLVEEAVKRGREITIVPYKGKNQNLAPSPEQMQELLIFIFEKGYADKAVIDCPSVNFYIKLKTAQNPTETSLCMAAQQIIRIDPEGNIHPCPFLDRKICNMIDGDLPQKIAQERARITDTYTGKCIFCTYQTLCGGCKASQNTECFSYKPKP